MKKVLFAAALVAGMSSQAMAQQSSCDASLAAFSALKTGMSYQQAVSIIGCEGSEMSRSEMGGYVTVMYGWSGGFLASMNAMFQNDKLVTKAQMGLK